MKRVAGDRKGATAIEYGLILALLVLAMLGGFSSLGGASGSMWGGMANKVINAG